MPKKNTLAECITDSMTQYFSDLNGQEPKNLHCFFIAEVEKPFLETVMKFADGNQSKAAEMLGINRNTLRKKLKTYNLA